MQPQTLVTICVFSHGSSILGSHSEIKGKMRIETNTEMQQGIVGVFYFFSATQTNQRKGS